MFSEKAKSKNMDNVTKKFETCKSLVKSLIEGSQYTRYTNISIRNTKAALEPFSDCLPCSAPKKL